MNLRFVISIFIISIIAAGGCQSNEGTASLAQGGFTLPEKVDFNFHIKPILSDRCFACHGPDNGNREAGLSLHTQEGLFALGEEGKEHIIVVGDSENSLFYKHIIATDPGEQMPPPESNLKLDNYEIALLKKWIDDGAEWKRHWAFIPPEKPTNAPASDWGNSAIDAWVHKTMQEQNMQPSSPAGMMQLLRRASIDTRGLPPTLQELEAFAEDSTAENYAQMVDAFLASTDHAERLSAWWLDIARYADTHGYQDDLERQNWPWRDWVIHAFHNNQPYDEFVTWQLAGDLIPDANLESILATAFNRNHKVTQEGGVIDEEFLVDYVADRTATTFTAFQGLTMECARCHDHKYDPISQKDFFSAFDFFNHVPENGRAEYGQIPKPFLTITEEEKAGILSFINAPDSLLPVHPMIMQDQDGLRTTHLLGRGQYDQPLEEVSASTPAAILEYGEEFPKNRLGLAQWLFDERNPLTARVFVNRIWQLYFGRGLVATADDFGNQGALPSHPELLDMLAYNFMHSGWDVRALEREILFSATYCQDSKVSKEALEQDSENVYLARAPQFRMSAEMIRDQTLATSGLLVDKVGGPSVKPYQPEGLWAEKTSGGGYTTYQQGKGEELYRKSLYTYWKRTVPPPSMLTFDAPTRDICTVVRQKTNTPLQALVLLNDPQQLEAARYLAQRIIQENQSQMEPSIDDAFKRIVCRSAKPSERQVLSELYQSELQRYAASPLSADSLLSIGDSKFDKELPSEKLAAMTVVVSTLYNLSETITRH